MCILGLFLPKSRHLDVQIALRNGVTPACSTRALLVKGESVMKPNFQLLTLAALVLFAGTAPCQTSLNFQVVGQNALFNRGMNAAATIFQNFLYIGNRTDGSSRCGFGDPRRTDPNFGLDACPHVHPGILILSISDPTNPTVVGEIPAPLNTSGQPVGITSRELRVWPSAKLLITMNFGSSSMIHAFSQTHSR